MASLPPTATENSEQNTKANYLRILKSKQKQGNSRGSQNLEKKKKKNLEKKSV